MSALVGLILQDRAFLWADAAVTDHSGVLVGVASKTIVLPGQRFALTARGAEKVGAAVASHLEREGVSADEIEAEGEAIFADMSEWLASPGGSPVQEL